MFCGVNVRFKVGQWVPSRNPSKWIIINLSLLLYSLIISFSIVVALRENDEKPTAATLYLVWNFSTTLAWCIETGLESWWSYDTYCNISTSTLPGDSEFSNRTTLQIWWKEKKEEMIELVLAIYFLIGSSMILWKLNIKKENVEEELNDVAISILAYLYACVRDSILLFRGIEADRIDEYVTIE
mmetsp:Transcript_15864/g.18083  ORF Transcript_15864/g.18083 Transcript_15864/m.18083 type:complete len:184 (-) Transcript_15864:102-653(-)